MAELKNLSVRHDQIMDWLIANPALPHSVCAAQFAVTEPWLSSVIHSDLFQAKLQERQEQVFGDIAVTVKDRITALAHDSLKRLHERVVVETHVPTLVDAAELAIHALGFGPSRTAAAAPSQQVNVTVVTKDILAEARLRMESGATSAQARIPATIQQAEVLQE